jgi:hypothetical protein
MGKAQMAEETEGIDRFRRFLLALDVLCREHDVQLAAEGYDRLEVWDLQAGEPAIHGGMERVVDKTEKRTT